MASENKSQFTIWPILICTNVKLNKTIAQIADQSFISNRFVTHTLIKYKDLLNGPLLQ